MTKSTSGPTDARAIEIAGAPDTIRTCGLRLRRANANSPSPGTTHSNQSREGGVAIPRQPRHTPHPAQCTAVDDGQLGGSGAIPFFGRSSNGGFGLREVENALF